MYQMNIIVQVSSRQIRSGIRLFGLISVEPGLGAACYKSMSIQRKCSVESERQNDSRKERGRTAHTHFVTLSVLLFVFGEVVVCSAVNKSKKNSGEASDGEKEGTRGK